MSGLNLTQELSIINWIEEGTKWKVILNSDAENLEEVE